MQKTNNLYTLPIVTNNINLHPFEAEYKVYLIFSELYNIYLSYVASVFVLFLCQFLESNEYLI